MYTLNDGKSSQWQKLSEKIISFLRHESTDTNYYKQFSDSPCLYTEKILQIVTSKETCMSNLVWMKEY